MPNDTYIYKTIGEDGKEVEHTIPMSVVLEAVKETHMPKERFETDMSRRVATIIKNQNLRKPEELLDDEAFAAQIAEKHGFTKSNPGGDEAAAKQLREALAKNRQDILDKEVKPLQEKLTLKEQREQALLVRDLERQIIQAAAPYVKESMLKSPGKGKPAPIVTMLEDDFAYDEETHEFYVSDGKDGFALSESTDKGTTYKTVDERVAEWVATKDHADFVKPGQSGPGAGAGASGLGGGRSDAVIVLSQEEANDSAVFDAALKKVGGDYTRVKIKQPASYGV